MSEQQQPPIVRIPRAEIQRSTTNPRKTFNRERLGELVASVRERGILTPLWVRPRWCVGWDGHSPAPENEENARSPYDLIAGERRDRAAEAVGLEEVPCQIYLVGDREALEMQLIENLQREDLDPLEEAESYQKMLEMRDSKTGEALWTVETIAARIKCTSRHVSQRLKLLNLPEPAREALVTGELKPRTAVLIGRIPDEKLRLQATAELLESPFHGEAMSLREAEEHIAENYMKSTKGADFDTEDPTLVPEMGACSTCPHLAKNSKDIVAGKGTTGTRADMCLNPSCFKRKEEAAHARWAEGEIGDGRKVLTPAQAEKWISGGKFSFYTSKIVGLADIPESHIFGTLPEDVRGKTWAQLTAGQGVPVLVARVKGGKLEGIALEKALAAAEANGFKIKNPLHRAASKLMTAADREEEKRKQEEETQLRKAVNKAALEQLAGSVKADPLAWLQRYLKRQNIDAFCRLTGRKITEVRAEIDSGIPAKICPLAAQIEATWYFFWDGSLQPEGAKFFKTFDVDLAKIKKRLVKERGDAKKAAEAAAAAKKKKPEKKAGKTNATADLRHADVESTGFSVALQDASDDELREVECANFGIDNARCLAIRRELDLRAAEKSERPVKAKATRVKLVDQIRELLTAAGPEGVTVQEIAKALSVKSQNVHVWFSTTGKKQDWIAKVGEARFAFIDRTPAEQEAA
jgi:ParB/RepB/Spo0J family partition protein